MPSKDVIYIESGSGIPFISFGSRAAKNLIVEYTNLKEEVDMVERIEAVNRAVISEDTLEEVRELVGRVGFVTIEMVKNHKTFFDIYKTKALMEVWDD